MLLATAVQLTAYDRQALLTCWIGLVAALYGPQTGNIDRVEDSLSITTVPSTHTTGPPGLLAAVWKEQISAGYDVSQTFVQACPLSGVIIRSAPR
jgi:hypothetical protein